MSDELKRLEKKHIMQTYVRSDVIFDRGEGCYLYDLEGNKYLDFVGGVAVCVIGHDNQEVAAAVNQQMKKLISVSDLYYTKPQIRLAQKLSELSGLQKSFFCHAGADSNETAIKLAEKITGKHRFIAFEGAFHGRTTGSLALTWKKELKEPFLPLLPEVSFVPYGNIDELAAAIDQDTAGVFIEPIEGESGVIPPEPGFLKQVRDLCSEKGVLMIVDEVQTGMGRTGKFLAYQHEGIKPDIVTLAKGLANGIPIGVCLSDYEFGPGEHGSTLGGNAISSVAALATIHFIEKHHLADNAAKIGDYIIGKLQEFEDAGLIEGVRGKGLMLGILLKSDDAAEIVQKCLARGLVINAPVKNVLRILPPLTITEADADEFLSILKGVLDNG